MLIKELTIEDKDCLFALIDEIESTLDNKEFWLPINDISRSHFFDREWTRFFGMFENDRIIGASALFFNPHEYGESLLQLGKDAPKAAEVIEIGRSMVKPDYRGKNILLEINRRLIEEAKVLGKKYVIATIHPNNLPSKKSFEKLGLEKVKSYTKSCGYVRDIYFMKL